MNLALALFWIGALHLSAVSSSLLYRTIRDDENGRDGGSSDEPSALDAAPSLAPLVPLRFSFLTTDGGAGEGLRYSDYSIPALELAVEHVNANSRVLPRFNLSYDLKQLECSTEAGLDAFFQDMFSQDTIIAFLGSACPQAVQPIAELVHRWNISEILSSPLEIDTSEGFAPTPNLLRLYPQESSLVPALLSLSIQAQWKRMLVISGRESTFRAVFAVLSRNFQPHNITVTNRQLSDSPISTVPDLLGEADDYRIIFLNVNPRSARAILCKAYHKRHVYPLYTWILYGRYGSGWWRDVSLTGGSDTSNCSDDEISSVLKHSLALRVYPKPLDEDVPSDAGISYSQFHDQYSQLFKAAYPDWTGDPNSFIAPLTYDAVWALALALHRVDTSQQLQLDVDVIPDFCAATVNGNANLGDFNYSNFNLGCRIRQELLNTNFVGVSGDVTLNEEGARHISDVTLLQYRSSAEGVNEVEFSEYQLESGRLVYLSGESNDTVFPSGITPDGTPRNITITFYLALTATYYIIAAVGIVFTFICLIFNVKYRNARVVKLTSPTINYFLIVGAFMMFLSIYIRVLPHKGEVVNTYRCNIQAWMNTIAYCFGYGTILTKMGRVYKIFHNPSGKKNKIGVKDWHMVMIVGLITGVGILLLIIGTAFLRPNLALLPSDEYDSGKDHLGITINYYAWQCYGGENKVPFYYLLFIYSYLGLLQLIGLVLAIRTRKVKISVLNDSKYITAIVYVSSLVVVVMMLVTFVSGNLQNLNEAFFSAGLLLSTYIFLGLTFIPKMISYYRDPHGDNMMRDLIGAQGAKLQNSGVMHIKTTEQEKITTLQQRVSDLEGELTKYKTLNLTDVQVQNEFYVNSEEDIPSPTTTLSHISNGSFSQAGSFSQPNHRLFVNQGSLENGSGGYGVVRTSAHSGFLRTAAMPELKPSPLVRRVLFPSDNVLVTRGQEGDLSEVTSSLDTGEDDPPSVKDQEKHCSYDAHQSFTDSALLTTVTVEEPAGVYTDCPSISETNQS